MAAAGRPREQLGMFLRIVASMSTRWLTAPIDACCCLPDHDYPGEMQKGVGSGVQSEGTPRKVGVYPIARHLVLSLQRCEPLLLISISEFLHVDREDDYGKCIAPREAIEFTCLDVRDQ